MRPAGAAQSAVLRIRGVALPDGSAVDLYADGDRWTTDPVANAELVAKGWLLPGLVDCHTHPGAEAPGQPLDEAVLREDLHQHVAAGVTMIRAHSQQAAGGAAAVEARVDSLEHGMCLDPDLLPQMAAQGTALTPTLSVITSALADVRQRPASPRKDWYIGGATVHGQLAAAAAEAGVIILAGTDSRPHGRVADEVRALVSAGLSPHQAIGSASWAARSYLGLDGLTEGAPADAVIYDADPRRDLSQLAAPRAVILRGQLQYRRT